MYHFGDACVCVFVKDFEDDRFISKMKELFMVFKDHVVQLHDIQNLDKEKVKKACQEIKGEEQTTSPAESNATTTDEVVQTRQPKPASKQVETSNEVSLVEKKVLDVVVVFSSKYDVAPINFVSPSTLTKDCVQAMLDLDLTRQKDETQMLVIQTMTQQREEIRKELQAYAEQQRLENKQYKQSIQSVVATQFTNLSKMLLQNLQQA